MKTDDVLRLVLPSCLTPNSELLAGLSPQARVRNKASHYLSYLHTGRYDQQRERTYVSVSSGICKDLYTPKAYNKMRTFLLEQRIIESDHDYRRTTEIKAGHCKGWRISEEISQDSIITEIQDKALMKKLTQQRGKVISTYSEIIARMEIDLRSVHFDDSFHLATFIKSLPEGRSTHAIACLINAIIKIQDSDCALHNTIIQGHSSQRYFHKLNNTSKELRPLLLFEGERSCEVDVANCQPLLMACILRDPHMILSCSAGMFYEDLLEHSPMPLARSDMKVAVLKDVIGYNPSKVGYDYRMGKPAHVAFMKAFPQAYSLNEEFRTKHGDLAMIRQLQRLESQIIHENVLPMIQQEGCPAVTIHDCVMTDERSTETVKACLELCFEDRIGKPCKIKLE